MKTANEIKDYLVKATGMPIEKLQKLLSLGKYKRIKKKDLLAEPGIVVEHSYFLINGIVRHFVVGENDNDFTKHFMRGPDFVVASIPDFFLRTKDSIHCEALTDIEVIEWTYHDLIAFAEEQSIIGHPYHALHV